MMLTLEAFGGVSVLELLLYTPPVWPARRPLAAGLAIAIGASAGILFAGQPSVLTGLLTVISLYRIGNILRIVEAKMHLRYLHQVTVRTSAWLLALQLVLAGVWNIIPANLGWGWPGTFAAIDSLIAIGLLVQLLHQKHTIQIQIPEKYMADRDLPSISVCIPARNETLNLEACLKHVLASDYPKLEILVLDDASHDRTPDIIKSFAHDGVRFIRGDAPPGTWLAKNWAYQRLYEEANGKYVVFCGVDARCEASTLRDMVQLALSQSTDMLSVLPMNIPSKSWHQTISILLQPLRYAWEICLPRTLFGRPPVLSTCWLVNRSFMKQYGGFAAVSRMVTPESYFARQAAQQGSYRLIAAASTLSVSTSKPFTDQWDTAVRTRYPQLHKRPEFVLLLSVVLSLVLLLPFGLLVYSFAVGAWLVLIFSGLSVVLLTITYSLVAALTYRAFQWQSIILTPIAIVLDVYTRHYSMWRYEFKDVTWKGRDVTAPVMHVFPQLPALDGPLDQPRDQQDRRR